MNAKPQAMSAQAIVSLLWLKFQKDWFCTSEASVGGRGDRSSMRRLDFLAIAPSWSSQATIGFEVKVTRADFVGDNKWPEYLPYCDRFWFVTAPGVVRAGEIPDNVGWMEASKNGRVLLTKKKAPNLPKPTPEKAAELYKSIIHRHHYGKHVLKTLSREKRLEDWREWLDRKDEEKELGRHVARNTRVLFDGMKRRVSEVEKGLDTIETFLTTLEAYGVSRKDFTDRHTRSQLAWLAQSLVKEHFKGEEETLAAFRLIGKNLKDAVEQFNASIERTTDTIRRKYGDGTESP